MSSGRAARKLGSTPSGMSRSPRIAEKSGCRLGPLLAAASGAGVGGAAILSPGAPVLAGAEVSDETLASDLVSVLCVFYKHLCLVLAGFIVSMQYYKAECYSANNII